MSDSEDTYCSPLEPKKRGKNWSFNDIINLLYAAINLNVIIQKFENQKCSLNIVLLFDSINIGSPTNTKQKCTSRRNFQKTGKRST